MDWLDLLAAQGTLKSLLGGKDGGGIGREDHVLPHKFLKRTFQRRANSTKQLLNADRGHQVPRKADHRLQNQSSISPLIFIFITCYYFSKKRPYFL